ncbi:hypothetical protein J4E90_010170 [Alternaria incomplexa]|uniref:uncharacterized protein n=1 Tax=Alternaria incomplexa TaxID=1187928 RepID=UPI002220ED99|nr:uncharacterized protein J4E90_010170 [Alternaria incomplexa]KAI4906711.1 hypothetical protein J4E90_010170 [Alternaria incomplexa]
MEQSAKELGLALNDGSGYWPLGQHREPTRTGVWDGTTITGKPLLIQRLREWLDKCGLLWLMEPVLWRMQLRFEYGRSPRLFRQALSTTNKRLQDFGNEGGYRNVAVELERVGLKGDITKTSAAQYLTDIGVSKPFQSEVVEPCVRARFSLDLTQVRAIDAFMACKESKELFIEGGNVQLVEAMVNTSQADVQLRSEVVGIENYVYFAVARYMQKTFGTYPPYPRMWIATKTQAENEALEDFEPGAPSRHNTAFDLEDADPSRGTGEAVSDRPYDMTIYPEWYQPIVRQAIVEPDFGTLAFSHPNIDVVCQTTSDSAQYDDCVAAFATLEGLDRNKVQLVHKRPGERWWANVVTTCAVQVHYKGDWSKCEASLSDIWAHAKDVFEGCHGEHGTVGGYVPFGVPNCPATIDLVSSRQWRNPDPF